MTDPESADITRTRSVPPFAVGSAVSPQRVRWVLVVIVICAIAAFTWHITHPPFRESDFQYYYLATRLWSEGVDPYALRPFTPLWPLRDRLFYPLPALILMAPVAWLRMDVAHVVFVTAAGGFLAWRISRNAIWPLLIFASPSFLFAAVTGQWSPWPTFAALTPGAGFLLAAKPTLGVACWCYRPSRWHLVTGAAITLVSLALMPSWPLAWLGNLHQVEAVAHPTPITYQWGPLLALAALRWRTREARLLLAMAFVPQVLFFYDQLPLFLVCRTRREALAFIGWGMAVMIVYLIPAFVGFGGPWALVACYLPALVIVLRRPNEGPAPQWIERRTLNWPQWIRGASLSKLSTIR